ncbi:beta-ketoacyl-ACP synthase III [Streptomyces sp. NPDC059002]|uniref:beta-ketoacyl-ACP synthase III n=1 Tax=Streptomyces sp. NPDC059002 TaxID=3346690 RepID=UPI0036BB94D3
MTRAGTSTAVITGVGAYLPPNTVSNHELVERLDTTDEWIRSRTGIARRHVISPGTTTADLAVEAGRRALKSAGHDRVDAVVLATTTPDRPCPATAPEVASRLGLTGVAAFDVSAVCTGFLYGLATGAGLIAAGTAQHVLVIAAEAFTTLIDPEDRATAPIFGDGAGAVVLRAGRADEPGAVGPTLLGSDGENADLVAVGTSGGARRADGGPLPREERYFRMAGRQVFRHAVTRMSVVCADALTAADWTAADVDLLVAHQANARITSAVADFVGIPPERRASNIELVGNTAGASVPVLLADAAADGTLRPGHRVLLTAFGGGLTWGAATLVWPDVSPVL